MLTATYFKYYAIFVTINMLSFSFKYTSSVLFWTKILASTIMKTQAALPPSSSLTIMPFCKTFCYRSFILQNLTASFSCNIFFFLHAVFSSFLCRNFTHQIKENLEYDTLQFLPLALVFPSAVACFIIFNLPRSNFSHQVEKYLVHIVPRFG